MDFIPQFKINIETYMVKEMCCIFLKYFWSLFIVETVNNVPISA